MKYLTCAVNKLRVIPYYPKLVFLNISHNLITDCSNYHNSSIKYFDCSFNNNFQLNFLLEKCTELYITDNNMTQLNLSFVPNVEILDCSNNCLNSVSGITNQTVAQSITNGSLQCKEPGTELIEINFQNNNISEIPIWKKVTRITGDNNNIKFLGTYPKLISINISHNNITKIDDQPLLKKIIANNNQISSIGNMPCLELIELKNNKIENFIIKKMRNMYHLQFNPILNLDLSTEVLQNIKELQISFKLYEKIYQKYYDNFKAINVRTDMDVLNNLLKLLEDTFNKEIIQYILNKFNNIKFRERENVLFK